MVAGLSLAADAVTGAAPVVAAPAQAKAAKPVSSAGPAWGELSARQQAALKPLAPTWNTISEAHKRKWIALSANFAAMHPEDQTRLHGRMSEWATLTPHQRAQARLNFARTKALPAEEKKAKWEAYQALSPEDKRKLASKAGPRPGGAAVAVKPVAPQKLATPAAAPREARHPAKIAVDPPHTETIPHAASEPPPGSGQ
jgi:hypothetical protein